MATRQARKALGRFLRALVPWGFTLLGIGCLTLYFKPEQLESLGPVRDMQLAAGALIGTILTLGFSLSIIPLQKASETFSPSILRLFRTHAGIQSAFVSLLAICFVCFGLAAAPVLGIRSQATAPVVLLLLGIGLDLLRRLYTLITQLLEP